MIITSFALCVCVCELDLLHHSWQQEQRNDHHNDSERQKKCKKRRMEVWGAKRALLVLNMEMKHIF